MVCPCTCPNPDKPNNSSNNKDFLLSKEVHLHSQAVECPVELPVDTTPCPAMAKADLKWQDPSLLAA